MFEYIKGTVIELNPAETIIENGDFGYRIMISLQTYEALQGKTEAKIYLYHYIREDEEQFYGFATRDERELFRLLISVSGVGVASARMMLSSLTDDEIRNAILSEDINRIKSVKGIGLKTAQRLILELKDKVIKGEGYEGAIPTGNASNAVMEEATVALVTLGFNKSSINKVLSDILKKSPASSVEELIKQALKKL